MSGAKTWIALAIILAVGFTLRVRALGYDLPYIKHPDEPVNIRCSLGIFKSGDPNPHFLRYPSLLYYANALAYVPWYVQQRAAGAVSSRKDLPSIDEAGLGVTFAPLSAIVMIGRAISVFSGMCAIVLTFLAADRLAGTLWGLFAALALAVSPTAVELNQYVTPDSLLVALTTATLVAAIAIQRDGRRWRYVLAGVLVGLAASTKYNGLLVAAAPVAAHFLRHERTGLDLVPLLLAGAAAMVAFVATTPYAVLDWPAFVAALRFEGRH